MKCSDAYDEMLIAGLDELRGRGTSPLARHLSECAVCRSSAEAILVGTMAVRPLLDAQRDVAKRRRLQRVVVAAGVPVAAAMAWVAFSTIRRPGTTPSPPAVAEHSAGAAPARQVSVDVRPGQNAVVMKTTDPRVTVVWLSPGVGQ